MIFLLFAIPKIYLYRGVIWGNMRIELVIGCVHHQYRRCTVYQLFLWSEISFFTADLRLFSLS